MKYAQIAATSSGNNEVVAAVANKRIVVVSYLIGGHGSADVKWVSGSSTDLSGLVKLSSGTIVSTSYGAMTPIGLVGLFATNTGEALNINLSSAITVGGHITYIVTD